MANLRVLQVVWSLRQGGAERAVLDLCRALSREGIDPIVAAIEGGVMESAFQEAHIPLHVAMTAGATYRRWPLVGWIADIAKESGADVLHTHLGADFWGGIAAVRHGIRPWVATMHSHMPEDGALRSAVRGWLYRRADRVLCVSEELKTMALERYGLMESKTQVVRVGIDTAHIAPTGARVSRDIPRIVSVGRLVPVKNQATLLRALAPIRRPWILDIVGAGPEEHRLHALAESLGILPRVRFAGAVPDVTPFLANADVFCFPSLQEGQGIVLLEAAAMGVPAIASQLPVLHETFDETSMVFVEATDVAAWTRAIEATLADRDGAAERAAIARRLVLDRFSLAHTAKAHAAVYRSLCPASSS